MNKVPSWAKGLKFWIILITSVFALYAGAAAIGLEMPRWAWISELRVVAGDVKSNRVQLYQGKVDSLERRHTAAIIALSRAKPGTRLYNVLFSKERTLGRQLDEAMEKLRKVRGF
jgi:hypothetical protein